MTATNEEWEKLLSDIREAIRAANRVAEYGRDIVEFGTNMAELGEATLRIVEQRIPSDEEAPMFEYWADAKNRLDRVARGEERPQLRADPSGISATVSGYLVGTHPSAEQAQDLTREVSWLTQLTERYANVSQVESGFTTWGLDQSRGSTFSPLVHFQKAHAELNVPSSQSPSTVAAALELREAIDSAIDRLCDLAGGSKPKKFPDRVRHIVSSLGKSGSDPEILAKQVDPVRTALSECKAADLEMRLLRQRIMAGTAFLNALLNTLKPPAP